MIEAENNKIQKSHYKTEARITKNAEILNSINQLELQMNRYQVGSPVVIKASKIKLFA